MPVGLFSVFSEGQVGELLELGELRGPARGDAPREIVVKESHVSQPSQLADGTRNFAAHSVLEEAHGS
jgi:hypothetical protein